MSHTDISLQRFGHSIKGTLVSIDLARELQAEGFPQNSAWNWVGLLTDVDGNWVGYPWPDDVGITTSGNSVSAPSDSELLATLPAVVILKGSDQFSPSSASLKIQKFENGWEASYVDRHGDTAVFVRDQNLAETLGRLWLQIKNLTLL